MAGQNYVGPTPTNPTDVATRLALSGLAAAATPNQVSAATDVATAAALKAAKTYVDTQDAQFVAPSYYQNQDALNVPNTALGAASGVATLDTNTLIPLSQFPAIGAGYAVGPFGPTATFAATGVTTTPVKIADWDIGAQGVSFQPVVFASVMTTASNFGRPVIEIRMSDGSATYTFQTLVALGFGRSNYNDEQAVVVWPAPGNPGQTGTSHFSPTMNIWLSAWLYDPTGNGVSATAQSIVSGSVFLIRDTI